MNEQSEKPKKKKSKRGLQDTTVVVLQNEVGRLETRLRAVERDLAEKENAHLRLERRAAAAEYQAEIMFDAIRILARAIPPDTAMGRKVRQEARQRLEGVKITPPGSLGSSRNRPRRTP